MTIDEAIAHAREEAKMKMAEYENHYDKDGHYYPRQCKRYAEQQEQLADWLEELKKIKSSTVPYYDGFKEGKQVGYDKAIDDFKSEIKDLINNSTVIRHKDVDEVAEQLKESEAE